MRVQRIRLTQLDGSLPNLALMKLSHGLRAQGHEVFWQRSIVPQPNEGNYDRVYGSSIFRYSQKITEDFTKHWPGAVVGGTGTLSALNVEQVLGADEYGYEYYDYSGYPEFKESIGFTQRGCRLSCKFCVVPKKEGKPRSVNTIADIWRGDPYPKKLHILDNDFFGQPQWRERIEEIRAGGFRVCLSQGINVRMITDESAAALGSIQYRDTRFKERKLYTAWDNLGDERVFFTGVDCLERHGVPAKHLRAYMLVGFDIRETWERVWYRFKRMVDRGIEPYVMVYDRTRADLISMQRWCNRGLYRIVPWGDYIRRTKTEESLMAWQRVYLA